jgi:hypothetical protein
MSRAACGYGSRGPRRTHVPQKRKAVPDKIQRAFLEFHRQNPEVYDHLVGLARRSRDRGCRKTGIGHLWEVMRWHVRLENVGEPDFKLNNNYRSRYARLIMAQEPDLLGFFELRELQGEEAGQMGLL